MVLNRLLQPELQNYKYNDINYIYLILINSFKLCFGGQTKFLKRKKTIFCKINKTVRKQTYAVIQFINNLSTL